MKKRNGLGLLAVLLAFCFIFAGCDDSAGTVEIGKGPEGNAPGMPDAFPVPNIVIIGNDLMNTYGAGALQTTAIARAMQEAFEGRFRDRLPTDAPGVSLYLSYWINLDTVARRGAMTPAVLLDPLKPTGATVNFDITSSNTIDSIGTLSDGFTDRSNHALVTILRSDTARVFTPNTTVNFRASPTATNFPNRNYSVQMLSPTHLMIMHFYTFNDTTNISDPPVTAFPGTAGPIANIDLSAITTRPTGSVATWRTNAINALNGSAEFINKGMTVLGIVHDGATTGANFAVGNHDIYIEIASPFPGFLLLNPGAIAGTGANITVPQLPAGLTALPSPANNRVAIAYQDGSSAVLKLTFTSGTPLRTTLDPIRIPQIEDGERLPAIGDVNLASPPDNELTWVNANAGNTHFRVVGGRWDNDLMPYTNGDDPRFVTLTLRAQPGFFFTRSFGDTATAFPDYPGPGLSLSGAGEIPRAHDDATDGNFFVTNISVPSNTAPWQNRPEFRTEIDVRFAVQWDDIPKINVTSIVDNGTAGSAVPTTLVFTFDDDVDHLNLTNAHFEILSDIGGAATVGPTPLAGTGTTRTLSISATVPGTIVALVNHPRIDNGTPTPIRVHHDVDIEISNITANGSTGVATTLLTITFDESIAGMGVGDTDISIDNAGAGTATLGDQWEMIDTDGKVWTIDVTQVDDPGQVEIYIPSVAGIDDTKVAVTIFEN